MPIAAADPNPTPLDAPPRANAQHTGEAATSDFANFGDDVPPAVSERVDAAPWRGHGAGCVGVAPRLNPRRLRPALPALSPKHASMRQPLECCSVWRCSIASTSKRSSGDDCSLCKAHRPNYAESCGVLRLALRISLQQAVEERSPEAVVRGWKLFFLAPRMLQSRIEPRQRRADAFSRGRVAHAPPRRLPAA